jgi:hypothetical protein
LINFAKITRLAKIMKIPSTKYQISNKSQHAAHTPRKRWRCGSACAARDPYSKIQTKDPAAIAPNGIIPGSPDFSSWRAAILANVLVIEY